MAAKHQGLPTDRLILVSKSGFTPEAEVVARAQRIEPVSYKQINEPTFSTKFGDVVGLWIKMVTVQVLRVRAQVEDESCSGLHCFNAEPQLQVFDAEGNPLCCLGELVHTVLKTPRVTNQLLLHATPEHHFLKQSGSPHLSEREEFSSSVSRLLQFCIGSSGLGSRGPVNQ
jgi:hypothetical protein